MTINSKLMDAEASQGHLRHARLLPLVGISLLLMASSATAMDGLVAVADEPADVDAVDVQHDPTDIARRLRPQPVDPRVPDPDPDSVDTLVSVHDLSGRNNVVVCRARDAWGRGVGAARTRIEPRGIGFLLLSDMTNSRDVIASITCRTGSHAAVSATLIWGGQVETLDTVREGATARVDIPLAAHF